MAAVMVAELQKYGEYAGIPCTREEGLSYVRSVGKVYHIQLIQKRLSFANLKLSTLNLKF